MGDNHSRFASLLFSHKYDLLKFPTPNKEGGK